MLGRLQFWLQGYPDKPRPPAVLWVGNQLSSARYWTWRLTFGERRYAKRGVYFTKESE